MSVINFPFYGNAIYGAFANLPTNVPDGTLALTLDTYSLWTYKTSTATWIGVNVQPSSATLFPAGTAALPGVAIGTVSNGFYAPATNQIGMSLNGVAVFKANTSRFLFSDAGAGVTASFNRPDDAGVAIQLSNGQNFLLGRLTIKNASSSTTNFDITDGGLVTIGTGTATTHALNTTVQTTVGAAGAATALPANPTGYIVITVNGTARAIPYYAQA